MVKKLLLLLFAFGMIGLGFVVYKSYAEEQQMLLSRQRLFVQKTGNEDAMIQEIVLATPRVNQRVTNPLQITGKARGNWFFEANFSVELFDANNNSLGTSIAKATGEWMTTAFVPFTSEMTFATPTTRTGKLVLSNANPSGMPENDKELIIPVTF